MAILVRLLKKPGSLVASSDSAQIRSDYVLLEPGKEVGEHETGGGEELILVMEGTAEVSSGGKTETASAPSAVLVSAHSSHNVRNKTKVPLKYVYVYVMAMDGSKAT